MTKEDTRKGRLYSSVRCADCGKEHTLCEWIENDDRCPSCATQHIVPRLHVAVRAVQDGEMKGKKFDEVLDAFGLTPDDATNLLLILGCSPQAALDVERTYLGKWPRSEWRRLISETRKEEAKNLEEVRSVLAKYGVEIEFEGE